MNKYEVINMLRKGAVQARDESMKEYNGSILHPFRDNVGYANVCLGFARGLEHAALIIENNLTEL